MEINNFDLIKSHLSFNNKHEFYFIQVIQRKKDNNDVRVRSGYRLIKAFYIYSIEEFITNIPRIMELCNNNNARAYINMNVRNSNEVALTCINEYSKLVLNGGTIRGDKVWNSACGSARARGYKALWIVDIDTKDAMTLNLIQLIISECKHNDNFESWVVPTKNGYHIICNGFDTKEFNKKLGEIYVDKVDIHKNNPTLLYYNDISSQSE